MFSIPSTFCRFLEIGIGHLRIGLSRFVSSCPANLFALAMIEKRLLDLHLRPLAPWKYLELAFHR